MVNFTLAGIMVFEFVIIIDVILISEHFKLNLLAIVIDIAFVELM